MSKPRTRSFTIDLPEEALGDQEPVAVTSALRRLWIIEQVRDQRLTSGQGARLVGMPLARFLRELSAHGVAVLDAEPGELEEAIGRHG